MGTGAGQASIIVMQRKGRTQLLWEAVACRESIQEYQGWKASLLHRWETKVHKAQAIFNKIY